MRITKQRLLDIIQEETHNLKKPAGYSEKEWQARLDRMRKNKQKRKELNLPAGDASDIVSKPVRNMAEETLAVIGLSGLSASVLKGLAERFAPSLAASFAKGVTTFALGKLAARIFLYTSNPWFILLEAGVSFGAVYVESFSAEARRASKYKSTNVVQRLKKVRSFNMNLKKYPEEFSKEELQQMYQIIVNNLISNPDFDDPAVQDQLFKALERIEKYINIKNKQQKDPAKKEKPQTPAIAAAAASGAAVSDDDYIPNMEDFADIDSYEVELEAEKEKNKNKSTN